MLFNVCSLTPVCGKVSHSACLSLASARSPDFCLCHHPCSGGPRGVWRGDLLSPGGLSHFHWSIRLCAPVLQGGAGEGTGITCKSWTRPGWGHAEAAGGPQRDLEADRWAGYTKKGAEQNTSVLLVWLCATPNYWPAFNPPLFSVSLALLTHGNWRKAVPCPCNEEKSVSRVASVPRRPECRNTVRMNLECGKPEHGAIWSLIGVAAVSWLNSSPWLVQREKYTTQKGIEKKWQLAPETKQLK